MTLTTLSTREYEQLKQGLNRVINMQPEYTHAPELPACHDCESAKVRRLPAGLCVEHYEVLRHWEEDNEHARLALPVRMRSELRAIYFQAFGEDPQQP